MKWMKNDVSRHDISKSVKLIDLKGKWDQEVARFGHWTGSTMERNAFVSRFARNSGVVCVLFKALLTKVLYSGYVASKTYVSVRSSQSMKRGMRCVVNKDIYRNNFARVYTRRYYAFKYSFVRYRCRT